MPGHLIFTATRETRDRIAAEKDAMAMTPGGIRPMIAHVTNGGTAVARMNDASVGFKLPEGTTVSFDDECPRTGQLRRQAEMRVRRPLAETLAPHQKTALEALKRDDLPDLMSSRASAYGSHPSRLHRPGEADREARIVDIAGPDRAAGTRAVVDDPFKRADPATDPDEPEV